MAVFPTVAAREGHPATPSSCTTGGCAGPQTPPCGGGPALAPPSPPSPPSPPLLADGTTSAEGPLQRHAISERQAGLALFKVIVGPGILFLPAAIKRAGLAAAVVTSLLVAGISAWCMLLVLDTAAHLRRHGRLVRDFGDIGEAAFGRRGRVAVDMAVVTSQLGFCTAYCVFVAENVQAVLFEAHGGFAGAASDGPGCGLDGLLGDERLVYFIILVLIPVLIPVTWIRQLRFFWLTNLLASTLVMSSLLFLMLGFALQLGSGKGQSLRDLQMVDPMGALIYLGTASYAFEGLGVLLPIEHVMAEPERFPTVLLRTMGFACLLQVVFACMAYVLYGEATRSIITVSLSSGPFLGGVLGVQSVQIAWVIQVLLTLPLQLFPAAGITERLLWFPARRSGWRWTKNAIRTLLLLLCMTVALVGYHSVDNLVALIGALGCVPLAIVYPALFHRKVCASHDAPTGPRRSLLASPRLASLVVPATPPPAPANPQEDIDSPEAPASPAAADSCAAGRAAAGAAGRERGEQPLPSPPSPPSGRGAAGAASAEASPRRGGAWSDAVIAALGTVAVAAATTLAMRAWILSDFQFQVCVLKGDHIAGVAATATT